MTNQKTDHHDQVRQLFDLKAPTWSAKYAAGGRLTRRLLLFSAALSAHVPMGGRVLDLGCGTGELARAAAGARLETTACDISAAMLHLANHYDVDQLVQWIQLESGWNTLPFEDATFDAVVAASVMEYVADPVQILQQCARVLRSGGVLLCTVPNMAHPIRWIESVVSMATRIPVVHRAGFRNARARGYITYLSISQQRHRMRWWHTAAEQAGLLPFTLAVGVPLHAPLRLLGFTRNCISEDAP